MLKTLLTRENLLCAILLCAMTFCGCSSRKTLGADAFSAPFEPSSIEKPSVKAKTEIRRGESLITSCTFLTTAALAAWAASGKDWQLSSYASKHTPVYGSNARAGKASTVLEFTSVGVAALIYVITYFPPVDELFDYPVHQIYTTGRFPQGGGPSAQNSLTAIDAAKAAAVSGVLTSTTTELLKKYTLRPRPDATDTLSFPSGHTTAAAWANRYSAVMISGFNLPPRYEYPARGALALLTLGTAWGRVEAGRHYPSDVIAGALIGVALTDASFAIFQPDSPMRDVRFDIRFTNERSATTTTLSTTVDF